MKKQRGGPGPSSGPKVPQKDTKARWSRGRGKRSQKPQMPSSALAERLVWGIHAVVGVLLNPERQITKLYLTPKAAGRIGEILDHPLPLYEEVSAREIDLITGPGPVHQGALVNTAPLALGQIDQLSGLDRIVVLDQVTDPHNVGAILRSAAAFGISHLIMTQRHSPQFSGTIAKTASGGLEKVRIILVPNLAQALRVLEQLGYLRVGFEGTGLITLEELRADESRGLALILGAEENGLRRLTREHCDYLCRISVSGAFTSLNVSNAAAIAFHHFQNRAD